MIGNGYEKIVPMLSGEQDIVFCVVCFSCLAYGEFSSSMDNKIIFEIFPDSDEDPLYQGIKARAHIIRHMKKNPIVFFEKLFIMIINLSVTIISNTKEFIRN